MTISSQFSPIDKLCPLRTVFLINEQIWKTFKIFKPISQSILLFCFRLILFLVSSTVNKDFHKSV